MDPLTLGKWCSHIEPGGGGGCPGGFNPDDSQHLIPSCIFHLDSPLLFGNLAWSRQDNMNNEQFRKLLLANSAKSPSGAQDGASPSPRATGGAGSSALGSRLKSSIPMTP